jgi:hypothetical protein
MTIFGSNIVYAHHKDFVDHGLSILDLKVVEK